MEEYEIIRALSRRLSELAEENKALREDIAAKTRCVRYWADAAADYRRRIARLEAGMCTGRTNDAAHAVRKATARTGG